MPYGSVVLVSSSKQKHIKCVLYSAVNRHVQRTRNLRHRCHFSSASSRHICTTKWQVRQLHSVVFYWVSAGIKKLHSLLKVCFHIGCRPTLLIFVTILALPTCAHVLCTFWILCQRVHLFNIFFILHYFVISRVVEFLTDLEMRSFLRHLVACHS